MVAFDVVERYTEGKSRDAVEDGDDDIVVGADHVLGIKGWGSRKAAKRFDQALVVAEIFDTSRGGY